jgi:hypothetical protein
MRERLFIHIEEKAEDVAGRGRREEGEGEGEGEECKGA